MLPQIYFKPSYTYPTAFRWIGEINPGFRFILSAKSDSKKTTSRSKWFWKIHMKAEENG